MGESPAPEELGWNLFQDDGEADEAFGKSSLLSSQSLSPPHPHNDSLRFFTDAELDATPVERESLKRHTRLYGLFFKELSVEIRFMDSQATLRRRTGYWGYRIISTMAILLDLSLKLLPQLYLRWACSVVEDFTYKEQYCDGIGQKSTTQIYNEQTDDFWKIYFPVVAGWAIVGTIVHRIIHKYGRHKAYAMLAICFLYTALMLFFIVMVTVEVKCVGWPMPVALIMIMLQCSFVLFSGTSSFVLQLASSVILLAAYGITYYVCSLELAEQHGDESAERSMLRIAYPFFIMILLVFYLLMLAGSFFRERRERMQFLQRITIGSQHQEIIRQKTQNTELQKKLLNNMLPTVIVDQLQQTNFAIQSWDQLRSMSKRHHGVCILFAELEGFAAFSSQVHPSGVMEYLNDLFQVFDGLCDSYDVYKVETVGDQYVAAVGVVTGCMHNEEVDAEGDSYGGSMDWESSLHASSVSNTQQMIGFAKAIMKGFKLVSLPESEVSPALRIGIHTGPCMSGIVGTKNFRFCLFGDTMNTAARMEQKGTAACVHTTQDVVDLVPGERWEKLAKMEVKGKGSMQTYLLRLPAMADEEFEGGDNIASVVASVSKREYENPFFLQSKDDDGSDPLEEVSSAERLDVGSGPSVYQDIQPVSDAVYAEHTKWFGLCFKKLYVERAFLDGQARQGKIIVFVGYGLFAFVLAFDYLYAYLYGVVIGSICGDPAQLEICYVTVGPSSETIAEAIAAWSDLPALEKYQYLSGVSLLSLTPGVAAIIAGILPIGCFLHWFAHQYKYVKRKYWATLLVIVVNFVLATLMILNLFLFVANPLKAQKAFSVLMVLGIILLFFSGTSCVPYVCWWILLSILYYALMVPAFLKYQSLLQNGSASIVLIIASNDFIQFSLTIFWMGIFLVVGSYLNDKTSRKRFLLRVLMVKQQNQIIREKSRNERMQRHFLENILPANVVEKLQRRQLRKQRGLRMTLKKSFKSSISQRHFGVGMLYADLVGFTSFCKQVDPFSVMVFLNDLFEVFDGLCDDFNMYVIETVGDCYVATVGVVTGEQTVQDVSITDSMPKTSTASRTNAKDLVSFAKAMVRGSRQVKKPVLDTPALLRVGLHTGSCISGIIGTRNFNFSLLGDDVKIAAAMEKTGVPDCIHASEDIVKLVPEERWEKCKVHEAAVQSVRSFLLSV